MTDIRHTAAQATASDDPAIPAGRPGRPITIILNSGSGSGEKKKVRQQIMQALAHADPPVTLIEVKPAVDFLAACERAVLQAKQSGGLVAAAGGDGTVNMVAGLCCKHDVPLGVIPLGTFNYFSRGLNIPGEPEQAAKLLLGGRLRTVPVGFVNDRLFLNNASFGLYTRIIREREQDKSRFGRFRIVALLSGIATVLRGQRPFAVKIVTDDGPQLRRTSMIFVGNNTLQLNNLDLEVARCTDQGKLAVVVLKPTSRIEIARLLLRGLLRSLNDDTRLEMFCADAFDVESKRRKIDVVVDGEVIQCRTPLRFHTARDELKVVVPMEVPDT
jgi:diacylglycerol kinase family enzyme